MLKSISETLFVDVIFDMHITGLFESIIGLFFGNLALTLNDFKMMVEQDKTK